MNQFTDTPEQARADTTLTVFDYTPDTFRTYFTSPFDQYKERVGQRFTVVGPDPQAVYQEEFEDMYLVKFEDGQIISAWGHEVCVLVRENCK